MTQQVVSTGEMVGRTMVAKGVIFRRSIRSTYAVMELMADQVNEAAVLGLDCNAEITTNGALSTAQKQHLIIVVQFPFGEGSTSDEEDKQATTLTQASKRFLAAVKRRCRLGDLVELTTLRQLADRNTKDRCQSPPAQRIRFVLHVAVEDVLAYCENTDKNHVPREFHFGKETLTALQHQYWNPEQCQQARLSCYPCKPKKPPPQPPPQPSKPSSQDNVKSEAEAQEKTKHGGRSEKRRQGEILADFLIQILTNPSHPLHSQQSSTYTPEYQITSSPSKSMQKDQAEAIAKLSSGAGVLDVAGGNGHVSLALALRGVMSTVVDPRPSAGHLPRRERRNLRRALHACSCNDTPLDQSLQSTSAPKNNSTNSPVELNSNTPKVIPFGIHRAWFGSRPDGIDPHFREGKQSNNIKTDQSTIDHNESSSSNASPPHQQHPHSQSPQHQDETITCSNAYTKLPLVTFPCSSNHTTNNLLASCSALVALHPDEATEHVVHYAVKLRKPFVVVPCCVFSRLFPHRRVKRRVKEKEECVPVTTYEQFLEYLCQMDESIRVTKLPFYGANLALWSTFCER